MDCSVREPFVGAEHRLKRDELDKPGKSANYLKSSIPNQCVHDDESNVLSTGTPILNWEKGCRLSDVCEGMSNWFVNLTQSVTGCHCLAGFQGFARILRFKHFLKCTEVLPSLPNCVKVTSGFMPRLSPVRQPAFFEIAASGRRRPGWRFVNQG